MAAEPHPQAHYRVTLTLPLSIFTARSPKESDNSAFPLVKIGETRLKFPESFRCGTLGHPTRSAHERGSAIASYARLRWQVLHRQVPEQSPARTSSCQRVDRDAPRTEHRSAHCVLRSDGSG